MDRVEKILKNWKIYKILLVNKIRETSSTRCVDPNADPLCNTEPPTPRQGLENLPDHLARECKRAHGNGFFRNHTTLDQVIDTEKFYNFAMSYLENGVGFSDEYL
jgi:hypothetical protein